MVDSRRLIDDIIARELETAREEASREKQRLESEYAAKGLGISSGLLNALLDVEVLVINRVLAKRIQIESEGLGLGQADAELDIRSFLDSRFAALESEFGTRCQAVGLGGFSAALLARMSQLHHDRLNYFTRELRIVAETAEATQLGGWPPAAMAPETSEADVKLQKLYNANCFKRDLREAARRCSHTSPLSTVMLDVDNFKSVNDRHGHIVGDRVLELIASSLTDVVGHRGRAYRGGGEELAMLLPNCAEEEAAAIAERVRLEVTNRSTTQLQMTVTVSGGLVTSTDPSSHTESIEGAADKALLHSKRNGKNQISRYSQLPA